MKKLLGIVVLCLLLCGNAYANLFNTKTYAKCKFQSQSGKISFSTASFQLSNYVEYFAFDKEFFYFKYNIANKDFDTKIAHDDGDESMKRSYGFFNDDKSAPLVMIFDGTTGGLKVIETPGSNGSLKFLCEKMRKNKLPKSKF
tara:strand:- start:132 stop:560 length:429 start_codon:yes stop_codon:yes gene_type:complete